MYCIVEWDCGHYYASTVALAVLFSIAVVIIIVLLVLLCRKRDKNRSYNVSPLFVCTNKLSFTLQSSKLGQKCNILQRCGMTSFSYWLAHRQYLYNVKNSAHWRVGSSSTSLIAYQLLNILFTCSMRVAY